MADYNDLVTDIQAYTMNSSAELQAAIPSFVRMAEDRIYRKLRASWQRVVINGTIGTNSRTIARPSDLALTRSLRVVVNGFSRFMQYRESEFLYDYIPAIATTAEPLYWGLGPDGNYLVAPNPDATYSYDFSYYRRLAPLTPSAPGNFLTDNAYDVIFAAAMVNAALFLQDDRTESMAGAYEKLFNERILELNKIEMAVDSDGYEASVTPSPVNAKAG